MQTIEKFKVVLLGDESVGKTSLITRFVFDTFFEEYKPSAGIDFLSKTFEVENKSVRLQLWDHAGQVKYRPLIPSLIRDSNAAIICYDITGNQQHNKNIPMWVEIIKKENRKEILTFILGNKSDLQQNRKIDSNQTKLLNLSLDTLQHFEVSARSGYNLNDVFQKIAKDLLDQNSKKQESKEDIESLFSPEQGYNQPNSFVD